MGIISVRRIYVGDEKKQEGLHEVLEGQEGGG